MSKTSDFSNRIKCELVTALFGALAGGIYAQPEPPGVFVSPPQVAASVSVALPGVQIRVESDFYEPLAPQGEWVVIGSYGRCWRPDRVEAGWRPYCNGNWQRTEAGWYWVSDEPWAWATYHYGRWDFTDQYGWYWVPQTQWAPAWVSWHEGGGYVGWAPLQPSVSISVSGFVGFNQARIAPRAFVFVEQRRFLEPIRPATVVVNNTTIINKTVIISNTKIVNNTVINEGPKTQVIAQASGRKVQEVQVSELRRKHEAPVVARQQTPAPGVATKEKSVQTPISGEVERGKKAVVTPVPSQVEKPGVTSGAPAPPSPIAARVTDYEKPKPLPLPAETRSEKSRPVAIKERTEPKPAQSAEPSEKPAKKLPRKPALRERPGASEKESLDKEHGKKDKE